MGAYPTDQYAAIAEVEAVMNTMPRDDLDVEDQVRDADWVAQREQQQAQSPGERWTIFARERATQRLVGYTQVFFYDDWPGHVDQGDTGVHPDDRGHGLGRWLKAAMIDRIFREKPESFRIRTHNAFSNAPMLAINNELGFVVTAKQSVWEAAVDEVLRRGLPREREREERHVVLGLELVHVALGAAHESHARCRAAARRACGWWCAAGSLMPSARAPARCTRATSASPMPRPCTRGSTASNRIWASPGSFHSSHGDSGSDVYVTAPTSSPSSTATKHRRRASRRFGDRADLVVVAAPEMIDRERARTRRP